MYCCSPEVFCNLSGNRTGTYLVIFVCKLDIVMIYSRDSGFCDDLCSGRELNYYMVTLSLWDFVSCFLEHLVKCEVFLSLPNLARPLTPNTVFPVGVAKWKHLSVLLTFKLLVSVGILRISSCVFQESCKDLKEVYKQIRGSSLWHPFYGSSSLNFFLFW